MKDQFQLEPDAFNWHVSGEEWLALATDMADVGRWVYFGDTAQCHIDEVLLELTGLDAPQPMDADRFISCIHPDDLAEVERSMQVALSDDVLYETNFRFHRPDGRMIWLKGKGRPRTLEDGRQVLIGVNYDVSDLNNAVIANRMLAGEMAHRVKNLISLVSGMFRMAQRTADDPEALAVAFLGRLNALAALNDLIFESETRSVTIDRLFSRVFTPLMTDPRVSVDVADCRLNGTSAQTLVLAINELMTNAIKYGALKCDGGKLAVSIVIDEATDAFDLAWHETVPHPIELPKADGGFGMTVLTEMTKHTFDGDPKVEWRTDGLSFTCRWSASEMSEAPGAVANEQRLFEEAARATAAVQPNV